MGFNGSGVFQRLFSWQSDANASINIEPDRHDSEDDNLANGLSNCITKDGQTTITQNIPFNNKKLTGLGDATAAADALNRQSGDARYGYSGLFTLGGVITPTQITAQQDNYDPTGNAAASTLRLSSDASRTITGLVGGASGVVKLLRNVGSQPIVLADQSASSTAANRFKLGYNLRLAPGDSISLRYDGTDSRWYPEIPSVGAYRPRLVTDFTASGTWTPQTWTRAIEVIVQGGGGGGGGADGGAGAGAGAGAGGGAGGHVRRFLTAGWGASETVTIAAGGTPGAASGGGNGGTGGTSSFGTLAVANGGVGGTGSTAPSISDLRSPQPGAGGTTSVAGGTALLTVQVDGEAGHFGNVYGSGNVAASGAGASGPFGVGGIAKAENNAGAAGTGYGSGASGGAVGGSATDRAGGAGAPGLVIVIEYE